MTPNELRARTRLFAIGIVHLCRALPSDWIVRTLGGQLLRSGSSVAANYRSACRGRSDREFCAKIGIVADEADETLLWLELLQESTQAIHGTEHQQLFQEARELTAIFTASHHTARTNLNNRKTRRRSELQGPTPRDLPDYNPNYQITQLPNYAMTRFLRRVRRLIQGATAPAGSRMTQKRPPARPRGAAITAPPRRTHSSML